MLNLLMLYIIIKCIHTDVLYIIVLRGSDCLQISFHPVLNHYGFSVNLVSDSSLETCLFSSEAAAE